MALAHFAGAMNTLEVQNAGTEVGDNHAPPVHPVGEIGRQDAIEEVRQVLTIPIAIHISFAEPEASFTHKALVHRGLVYLYVPGVATVFLDVDDVEEGADGVAGRAHCAHFFLYGAYIVHGNSFHYRLHIGGAGHPGCPPLDPSYILR